MSLLHCFVVTKEMVVGGAISGILLLNNIFLSLLMNDYLLHNCMLDSGASSNVMTKKVMEQLNLRISRPYHNICAMDSKMI